MKRRDMMLVTAGAGLALAGGSVVLWPRRHAVAAADFAEHHPVTERTWDLTTPDRPAEYWREFISDDAWDILFREGTEPRWSSKLNSVDGDGTFVCAACHLPLFSAATKFDSGTGWPSFWTPYADHIETKQDLKLGVPRTEYHCIRCKGHQGHVFDDGPEPTGERWCNNGLALAFVPADESLPSLRG